MSFPRTYGAIERMIRNWLITTANARDIVRKAGIRSTSGDFVGHSENLWAQGWAWNTIIDLPWSLNAFSRPGVWGLWPTRSWLLKPFAVPGQYAYADLRGVAFTRAVLAVSDGFYNPTYAWVPAYSARLNPMETGDETPLSLAEWLAPDGRTLLEWDEDLRPGGARVFSWPPIGACYPIQTIPATSGPLAPVRGCHAGRWAPPPRDALGTDEVVCATAVIANPTEEELATNAYTFGLRAQVQLQSVAEDGAAWRAYFTDEIDD